jgi:coenzyme Q-binding protein COQ10
VTKFSLTRRLPFRPADLYAIAADVRRYPAFIPLCTAARVSDERTDPEGRARFRASVDIAYPKLHLAETFVSDVIADPRRLRIDVVAIGGPVKHLTGDWRFLDAPGGTDVTFNLDYQMSSRMLQFLMSSMFDYAMRKVLNAFEERARFLCGSLA